MSATHARSARAPRVRRVTLLARLWGLSALSGACWFDQPLKHDLGVVPEQLADGWAVATPESVGLSSAALARIHTQLLREDRFVGSLALLVIKDGKLVWETYLRSRADRDHYHHIQSITKSVTSIVFGMARDRGQFPSLDQELGALFPEEVRGLDPSKSHITLEQLLTMRSGIDFDNLDFNLEMYTFSHSDPLRYILDKPLYAAPGAEFYYRNADPQILSYAMQSVLGARLRELGERWLFAPLAIRDYYWEDGPDDGVTLAGSGLHLRPRDLAKIGELVLERGSRGTQRLLSSEWCDAMTSPHVVCRATPTQPNPDACHGSDAEQRRYPYGYYWWSIPQGFAGVGTGGQFLVIVPAQRLVLVHVALPNTSGLDGSTLSEFLELVQEIL